MARGGARPGAGRPKGSRNIPLPDGFLELEKKAVSVLKKHLDNGNEKVAQFVIEQIHGKARQKLEHTGEDGGAIKYEDVKNGLKLFTGEND